MLENAAHHHAHVLLDDVFRAIAMVHIEVDDRDALQAPGIERMAGGNGNIVEEAETHRACMLGMVAGRTHRTEGGRHFLLHHQVGGQHAGTGRAQRRLEGAG